MPLIEERVLPRGIKADPRPVCAAFWLHAELLDIGCVRLERDAESVAEAPVRFSAVALRQGSRS